MICNGYHYSASGKSRGRCTVDDGCGHSECPSDSDWLLRIASKSANPQEIIRDRANENVDRRYGHSWEFSPSPEAHILDYQDEEDRLLVMLSELVGHDCSDACTRSPVSDILPINEEAEKLVDKIVRDNLPTSSTKRVLAKRLVDDNIIEQFGDEDC